jgi:hypothetical protein
MVFDWKRGNMCNQPNCRIHQGKIVEPTMGLIRHCDSAHLRNSNCPYIAMGCLGCTLREIIDKTVRHTEAAGRESITAIVPAHSNDWTETSVMPGISDIVNIHPADEKTPDFRQDDQKSEE